MGHLREKRTWAAVQCAYSKLKSAAGGTILPDRALCVTEDATSRVTRSATQRRRTCQKPGPDVGASDPRPGVALSSQLTTTEVATIAAPPTLTSEMVSPHLQGVGPHAGGRRARHRYRNGQKTLSRSVARSDAGLTR